MSGMFHKLRTRKLNEPKVAKKPDLEKSPDPLATLDGYAGLDREMINAALRMDEDERAAQVAELAGIPQFYALAATIRVSGENGSERLRGMAAIIRAAEEKVARALKESEQAVEKEVSERQAVLAAAGFKPNGKRAPWAGIMTCLTQKDKQRVESPIDAEVSAPGG